MALPDHLFVASDGDLFDTRVEFWFNKPPLRTNYKRTHSRIETCADLKATLRAGEHAWPGGYPMYIVMADGEALSFKTARKELRLLLQAIKLNDFHGGWRPMACDINYEDDALFDAHTNEKIESAYGPTPEDNPVVSVDAQRGDTGDGVAVQPL